MRPRVLYCRPWLELLEARLLPVVLIPLPQPLVVPEGQTLTLQVNARPNMDSEFPVDFVFKLVHSQPGATIDPSTGVFQWTPMEDNGPKGFDFTVRVTDPFRNLPRDLGPPLPDTATENFNVQVLESPEPPVLQPISNQTVAQGHTVVVQALARDDDIPPNPITFSLTAAPTGASIDPISGLFQWTPAAIQPAGNYAVIIRAASTLNSDLFNETAFQITVTVPKPRPLPTGTIPLPPGLGGNPVTTSAEPNSTLVELLVKANSNQVSAASHGAGAVVFGPLNAVISGPFPVPAVGTPGVQIASLVVPSDAEVLDSIDFGTLPEEIPVEGLQQKPLKLSQTEGSSDGSSVKRLYTDFFGPAPSLENATRNEREPTVGESTGSDTQQ